MFNIFPTVITGGKIILSKHLKKGVHVLLSPKLLRLNHLTQHL